MSRYFPIKKVLVGFVAAGLMYAARRAGVDLGSDDANEAAVWLVGFVFAYAVKDPQVKTAA